MRSAVLFASLLLACSKPVDPAPVASTASAAPVAAAAPAASAAPVDIADAGLACGRRPLPDCPLQAWMKANANPAVMANDTARLAVALDAMVALAPPGTAYPNWTSIAKDGAAAARGGDVTAAKAACRGCHDEYKAQYRTEMRARKI